MKRFALALTCVLAGAAPAVSRASLTLQVGPERGADAVDAVVAPGSGEHFFDLVFHESGPPDNEQLIAYDLLVEATRPGISLVRVEQPDNWVLTPSDAAELVQNEVEPDHILAFAGYKFTYAGPLADINTGEKAARIYYTVDPGAAPGLYRITLNPGYTIFGFGDPNCEHCHGPVFIDDPGLIRVTPEPAGLALIGAVAVLVLQRRRNT